MGNAVISAAKPNVSKVSFTSYTCACKREPFSNLLLPVPHIGPSKATTKKNFDLSTCPSGYSSFFCLNEKSYKEST